MSNLFKCLTCNMIISSEERATHLCRPIIKKHKIIPASSYFTVLDENGRMNVVIDGFDNVGYVFEIKEPKIIPIEALPEMRRNLTEIKTDKDLTESKANKIRDMLGYEAEDAECSIEEKAYKALHPDED